MDTLQVEDGATSEERRKEGKCAILSRENSIYIFYKLDEIREWISRTISLSERFTFYLYVLLLSVIVFKMSRFLRMISII